MAGSSRPLALAVLLSTLVALGIIAATELVRSRVSSTPGFGFAWTEHAMFCGGWPSAEKAAAIAALVAAEVGQPVAQGCAFSNKTIVAGARDMDAPLCAAWCAMAAPAGTGGWCCAHAQDADGSSSCAWSNGVATMLPGGTAAKAQQAFSSCASASSLGDAGPFAWPYDCPANKMHDAMFMNDHGGCSQICLPRIFFRIAKRHGVTQGRCCEDHGFCTFESSRTHSGVHYNTYLKSSANSVSLFSGRPPSPAHRATRNSPRAPARDDHPRARD